ncbi:hypothetical protein D3C80_1219610 [compost metagenome]
MPQGRRLSGRDRTGREDRLGHGAEGRPPLHRRRDPGLDRQLHPVGIRHGRHLRLPGPRSARPGLRSQIRPAGDPGRPPRRRRRRLRRGNRGLYRPWLHLPFGLPERPGHRGRQGRGHRPHRGGGSGRGQDHLSSARLGCQPPALLGLPHPHHPLRDLRPSRGSRRPVAGRTAQGRDLRRAGQPAGPSSDLEARQLPDLRRRGPSRNGYARHLRRFQLVLRPLRRSQGR